LKKHFTYENRTKTTSVFCHCQQSASPNTKATYLIISPQATTTTWNNSKNLEDRSFGMKHPEKRSYTIPESSLENKWGGMAKAWVNKVLFMTKVCSRS
jgi:hypothetical protein